MNKKKLYGSLILNIFTLISVIIITIILLNKRTNTFKMFTTQSNVFSGVVSLVVIVFEILIICKKLNELPNWVKIIKMATTTGVTLTFLVVTFYLGFVAIGKGYNYFVVFRGTNVFFHFLTPISCILSFVLFEGCKDIKLKYTFLNMIHMVGYTIFYSINVLTHLKADGTADRKYDWYYFMMGEKWTFVLVVIGMMLITYGIGVLLWWINKRIDKTQFLNDKGEQQNEA